MGFNEVFKSFDRYRSENEFIKNYISYAINLIFY